MSAPVYRNAQIKRATLHVEDHGILTVSLVLEWPGCAVCWGGYALDRYDHALKQRIGTAWGLTFIQRVLSTVGVSSWDKLEGKYVRIVDGGLGSRCTVIGHITEEKWLDPENDAILKSLVGAA